MLQNLFHDELRKLFETQIDSIEGLNASEIQTSKESLNRILEESSDIDVVNEWIAQLPHKVNWEKKLLEWMPHQEADNMDIPAQLLPKMHRGLPRDENHRYLPSFTKLDSLKRCYLEKSLYSFYRNCEVFPSCVVVWTHVLNDGLGDYYAGCKTATILQEALPNTEVHFVAHMDEKADVEFPENIPFHRINYQDPEDISVSHLPDDIIDLVSHSDLLFEVPTYYTETPKLLEMAKVNPRFLLLGEYGSIHCNYFHPETGAKAMGLHFLEKGIFITEPPGTKSFMEIYELEHPTLLNLLFESDEPDTSAVENYLIDSRFYFSYLASKEGAFVYLHALTKLLETDLKNIDLCVPNIAFFLEIFSELKSYNSFTKAGVSTFHFHIDGNFSELKLKKSKGKILRIIHLGTLSSRDYQILLRLSSEFTACRGNQSLSECISANKVFFYDLVKHNTTFWKDFVSLAENRIPHYPTAIEFFRLFLVPLEESSQAALKRAGTRIGELLQNVETVRGVRILYKIIRTEYAVNDFIIDMVKRSLVLSVEPELEQKEKKIIDAYLKEEVSFSTLWDRMHMLLSPYKTKTHSVKDQLHRLFHRFTSH